MGRVAFYLKRPTEEKPQCVFALYHVQGKQVKIYTPISVRPKDWSKKTHRVKPTAPNSAPINDKLGEIARHIEEAAFRLQMANELTPERLKSEVEGKKEEVGSGIRSLTDHVDEWIGDAERRHRHQTIKNYRTFKGHLERFCKVNSLSPSLLTLDPAFIRDFAGYLSEVINLQNTSRWNVLKTFKTFLGWAYEEGRTTNRVFEKIKRADFHVIEPIIVRLSDEELQAIEKLDLSDSPHLENARDLFVLQCNLGVRYGDLIKIGRDHIEGDALRLTTEKNRKDVVIPLSITAKEILLRESPPYIMANQKLNAYLKEIGKKAGVKAKVIVPRYVGTGREDVTCPKYELLSTHTAKRTFISRMAARGVSIEVLMKITGNSRGTIDRYIELNSQEVTAQIKKAGVRI